MGGMHSKKHRRANKGRAVDDTKPGEADDTARVSHTTSNHKSTFVPSSGTTNNDDLCVSSHGFEPGSTSDTPDAPKADYFVLESGGIRDKDILDLVRKLAKEKGPQLDGYSTVICGITVRWKRLEALGGDRPRDRSTPLEKVVNPQGNNPPPVRALYPQLAPPAEPRA